jgi:hypothetical protein
MHVKRTVQATIAIGKAVLVRIHMQLRKYHFQLNAT